MLEPMVVLTYNHDMHDLMVNALMIDTGISTDYDIFQLIKKHLNQNIVWYSDAIIGFCLFSEHIIPIKFRDSSMELHEYEYYFYEKLRNGADVYALTKFGMERYTAFGAAHAPRIPCNTITGTAQSFTANMFKEQLFFAAL